LLDGGPISLICSSSSSSSSSSGGGGGGGGGGSSISRSISSGSTSHLSQHDSPILPSLSTTTTTTI